MCTQTCCLAFRKLFHHKLALLMNLGTTDRLGHYLQIMLSGLLCQFNRKLIPPLSVNNPWHQTLMLTLPFALTTAACSLTSTHRGC